MLKRTATAVAAIAFGSMLNCAAAYSPIWELVEVYSNADGSIQFVVHWTPDKDQQYLGGHGLVALGDGPNRTPRHTFTFPGDLPGDSANHYFLIATQGFADLGVLKPDYVVPNGFFPISGGDIGVAGHVFRYPPLPTDGVKAYWAEIGYFGNATAMNFAGGQDDFHASAPPTGSGFTGSWYDPAQSGHGFALQVLAGPPQQLLAYWFTFAPQGGQSWIAALGPIDGNRAVLQGVQTVGSGARFPPNFDTANARQESWGTLTFTFGDCNHGRVDWSSTVPGYGSGGLDLTRLTLPAGLTCH